MLHSQLNMAPTASALKTNKMSISFSYSSELPLRQSSATLPFSLAGIQYSLQRIKTNGLISIRRFLNIIVR